MYFHSSTIRNSSKLWSNGNNMVDQIELYLKLYGIIYNFLNVNFTALSYSTCSRWTFLASIFWLNSAITALSWNLKDWLSWYQIKIWFNMTLKPTRPLKHPWITSDNCKMTNVYFEQSIWMFHPSEIEYIEMNLFK